MDTMTTVDHDDALAVRSRIATLLGLDAPVPTAVARGMACDELYAHHLFVSRTAPEFLQQLLANPPECAAAPELADEEHSTRELVSQALTSLGRWARSGLGSVDEATYNTRRAACLACPHLSDPPKHPVYKIATLGGGDRRVCGVCGCVAAKKAKLPTESCPARDPHDPRYSRWGDLVVEPESAIRNGPEASSPHRS